MGHNRKVNIITIFLDRLITKYFAKYFTKELTHTVYK